MTTGRIVIRDAGEADFPAVQQIYAHYVRHTHATFEEAPPTVDELRDRWTAIVARGLPYLVADDDGTVRGFAYASPYRSRSGYRYTVEESVYVATGFGRRGTGAALLGALIARCEAGPWRQMVAVVGGSDNAASIALHTRLGFQPVGTIHAAGFKLGRWADSVLMQRTLGQGSATLPG
jgi:phosphinothricin acetyltransferase